MKRVVSVGTRGLAILVLGCLAGGNLWAISDEEIFRDFRFNFINPGARSVGLGGAFIAAVDDATAVEANPAGLHYVDRFEVFVEYRDASPDSQLFSRSSGTKDLGSTEDFLIFNTVNNPEDSNPLSFVSFAYPFRIGNRRARLAVSRQVVFDAESSLTEGSNGTSLDISPVDFPVVVVFDDGFITERYSVQNTVEGTLDAELIHYNLGFSISLSQDFTLGVTATLADLDMRTDVSSITFDPLGILNSIHPRLNTSGAICDPDSESPDCSPIQFNTSINDSDSDLAFTIGLHWHPDSLFPNRKNVSPIRFGAVYHRGARLEVQEATVETNLTGPDTPETFTNVLRVPDRFGIGASYDLGRWVFALDVERINYSDLLEEFETGVHFFTRGLIPEDLRNFDVDSLEFDVDDETVFHVGVEYNFKARRKWSPAIRVGYFNDPDHKIRLASVDVVDRTKDTEDILLDAFKGGEDQDHFTMGFSLGFPSKRIDSPSFELQLAADFGDSGDEFVASLKTRFGRPGR